MPRIDLFFRRIYKNARLPRARLWVYGALTALVLSILYVPILSQSPYEGQTIRRIRFVGLKNTDADDLYPVLAMRTGGKLSTSSLNGDVKALFATGFFSNVVLRIQTHPDNSLSVFFEVTELPRISQIKFLGVEELYSADLLKSLRFREGEVYSLQKVKQGVTALKKKYVEEGFFLADVWYRIGRLDTQTNTVEVAFIVDEGENIPIAKINIIGTRNLNPESILGILEQKEEGVIEDGVFRENKFEEDKLKIMAFAKTRGFLEAEIDNSGTGYEIRWRNPSKPELGRVVVITYKIIEGDIRYFGGYSLEHAGRPYINQELNPPERVVKTNKDYTPIYRTDVLLRFLEYGNNNVGEIFDEGKYFRDRGFIQELYSRQGYVYAQVQPDWVNFPLNEATIKKYEACKKLGGNLDTLQARCKKEAEWLDLAKLRARLKANPKEKDRILRHVHFTVRENGRAYIENIIIKGMVKTQENVIRRQVLIKEGQLFNSALVKRSREKIANLGFFKEVNVKSSPGSAPDKMNLIYEVKEQPTGTISMGGGFGTASGFSIFTEVGENNLNGTGQKISGRLEFGPLRKQLQISWTNPWIYEACQDTTGSFWKKKAAAFDDAANLDAALAVAGTLRNNYRSIGKTIEGYIRAAGEDETVETLDRVKVRIRKLIRGYVAKEEDCYRSIPRPWALTLSAFWRSFVITNAPTINVGNANVVEDSRYERNQIGLSVGVSHTFLLNWAHFHRYSPSWSVSSRPTALVSDAVLREVSQGWQFKSSLTNGVVYDTRDSVFNPTSGLNMDLSLEMVGQALGGQDHFNRWRFSATYYHWWFDYTFGGLIRRNSLKRWRVVQEFRLSTTFTHETAPFSGRVFRGHNRDLVARLNPLRTVKQDKELNPFIEPEDRLFIGGYESLRGYDFFRDSNFPTPWSRYGGGSHMILAGTELRFPIEPSILWFVFFFDAGSLFNNIGEFTGDFKTDVENYESTVNTLKAQTDPVLDYIQERYNLFTFNRYPYAPISEWNNPKRSVLSQRNVALDRFLYSWGFGLRIQIPVLPLRLFLAQKRYYAGGGSFKPLPGDANYQFVFGIGDLRF